MKSKLRTKKIDAGIGNAGIGFVIIPIDEDREKYIENCYSTCKIDISGGIQYGILSDVLIDKRVLQNIRFPSGVDDDLFGSPVFWVLDEYNQVPVIISVFNEEGEYFNLIEGQSRIYKKYEDKSIDVSFDAKNSTYNLTLIGNSDNPSNYNVKIVSKNSDSKINIYTDNELNIESGNKVNLATSNEFYVRVFKDNDKSAELSYKIDDGLFYKDEFENEIQTNNNGVSIKSNADVNINSNANIIHNNGNESMVLGDTLKQLLINLISAIESITVTCSAPGSPSTVPINIAQFEIIKQQLGNILSNQSKLK